jgi:hypothetical protein
MSELKFLRIKAKVTSLNVRQELHGEEHKLACDIHIEFDAPNRSLDKLDPLLLQCFYWKNPAGANQEELEGIERVTDFPNLRFEHLAVPVKWLDKFEDGEFRVHHGDDPDDDIVEREVKINEIKVTPKEGGTVRWGVRVQCHPDEADLARLATVLQSEVTVTVDSDPDDEAEQPNLPTLEKPAKVTNLRKRGKNQTVPDAQVDQIAGALTASE